MSKNEGVLERMNEVHANYYSSNEKNTFFKKSQKIDCAKEVCKNIDINEMIAKTIYVIPGTNQIYMDYTIFKLFAHPDIFDLIISHIINSCRYLIAYYNSIEAYINLDTFTVSAAERYRGLIQKYCEICLHANTDFAVLLTKLHILNTPSVIEMIVKILKPVIDKDVVNKVVFHKKNEESVDIIDTLKKQQIVIQEDK